jgi:hypothetical protein
MLLTLVSARRKFDSPDQFCPPSSFFRPIGLQWGAATWTLSKTAGNTEQDASCSISLAEDYLLYYTSGVCSSCTVFPESRKYVFAVISQACSLRKFTCSVQRLAPDSSNGAEALLQIRHYAQHSRCCLSGPQPVPLALHSIFMEGPAPINDGRHLPWQVACTGRWDVDSYTLQGDLLDAAQSVAADGAVWQDSTRG